MKFSSGYGLQDTAGAQGKGLIEKSPPAAFLYEGVNHLGNVLVVFTDKRLAQCSSGIAYKYHADLIQAQHYSAFGAPMPGLRWYANSTEQYKFGFNGHEQDDEVSGDGNEYDYGARVYSSRLGRFLSTDNLKEIYPDLSPYNFAGNVPILLYDVDGNKLVNPYIEKVKESKLKVEESQRMYDELVKNHPGGDPSKKDLKKYLKESGLESARSALQQNESDAQEVEDYIYTLKTTNKQEYDYFETLTDPKNKRDINITISLEGENPISTDVGKTEGLAKYSDYTPSAANNELTIKLYDRGKGKTNTSTQESGRNYRTFANELGDIKYYFTKVKDKESYEFWYATSASSDPGYTNPEGAGEGSTKYENQRVNDVKNYAKTSLQKNETHNPYRQTIEKR